MHISKFTVLVAHSGNLDLKEIEEAIELALGTKVIDYRTAAVFEVRGPETTEVSLATVQSALDDHLIERATGSGADEHAYTS